MQALSLSNAVSEINYIFTDVKSVFQSKSRYVERSLRVIISFTGHNFCREKQVAR